MNSRPYPLISDLETYAHNKDERPILADLTACQRGFYLMVSLVVSRVYSGTPARR